MGHFDCLKIFCLLLYFKGSSLTSSVSSTFSDPVVRFQQGVVSEHVRGTAQVPGYRRNLVDGANWGHTKS